MKQASEENKSWKIGRISKGFFNQSRKFQIVLPAFCYLILNIFTVLNFAKQNNRQRNKGD